jgi:serine/threonine protein kinase
VALKKIFNPNITAELMQEIDNEIEMLSTLRHPNIVLLMAVTTKPPNLYIATEYVSKGSLYDLLHRTK